MWVLCLIALIDFGNCKHAHTHTYAHAQYRTTYQDHAKHYTEFLRKCTIRVLARSNSTKQELLTWPFYKVFFLNKIIICNLSYPEIQYIVHTGLNPMILLSPPPKLEDYIIIPSVIVFVNSTHTQTSEKRKSQLRNCLHQTGLWKCL